MIATILKVGEGTCAYCRRPIEQALTVRFPEGTTRVFCQRDALKQILMRADDQAEEPESIPTNGEPERLSV